MQYSNASAATKVKTIGLQTKTTSNGSQCVDRTPPVIDELRGNVDVIRVTNQNAQGSGKEIEVSLDRVAAGNLFDPVPAETTVLPPGASVDWTLKPVIEGFAALNFSTDPGNCTGQGDQGDIVVHC